MLARVAQNLRRRMRPKSWALTSATSASPRRWAYTDSDREEMDLIGVKAGAVVVDSVNGAPRPGFTIHWYPKVEAQKMKGGVASVEDSTSPESAAAAAAAAAGNIDVKAQAITTSISTSGRATQEDSGEGSDVSFFDKSNEKGFKATIDGSIMLAPGLATLWKVERLEDMTERSLSLLFALDPPPDILVVGCGDSLIPAAFIDAMVAKAEEREAAASSAAAADLKNESRALPLSERLRRRGIVLDAMSTVNACSTFNILRWVCVKTSARGRRRWYSLLILSFSLSLLLLTLSFLAVATAEERLSWQYRLLMTMQEVCEVLANTEKKGAGLVVVGTSIVGVCNRCRWLFG